MFAFLSSKSAKAKEDRARSRAEQERANAVVIYPDLLSVSLTLNDFLPDGWLIAEAPQPSRILELSVFGQVVALLRAEEYQRLNEQLIFVDQSDFAKWTLPGLTDKDKREINEILAQANEARIACDKAEEEKRLVAVRAEISKAKGQ
ncbi:hypothetical protein OU789_10875 [Halocynthiibacter sp. C4]|uniref:hypothetical protein n=1 Tax=Halocynthiibacter sp. C4 TaxID=2992758 RepID=UPI00237ABC8D|nr:hypothetical protein [Halocynthiibacter sp. C4]MDE0590430.1 hypothetical protein [Halocynthiibacter sp. C4]